MTAYTTLNDAELLALLRKDDEAAFTEIYNRYWKSLFAVAANKLGNLYEAEELVQDIFLDLWKRRNELDITNSLSSYISVAVNYKVINILARRSLSQRYSKELSHKKAHIDNGTEQWLQFEELRERLERSVAGLPEKCRLVFRLSREKGMSQKEIATTLNIAEKTVESHLSKALQSLRVLRNLLFFLW
jgi:RNA polymerase sigma-70 factor (family 1)